MSYNVLTVKENELATMLIEGENITDIAKKLNVTRQTVYNWMSKDIVKAELDRRRQELIRQGNNVIMKDLTTYIANIKELANDKSDKRVSLAANQYLLNRIYGNPTTVLDSTENTDEGNNVDNDTLQIELEKFKGLKAIK